MATTISEANPSSRSRSSRGNSITITDTTAAGRRWAMRSGAKNRAGRPRQRIPNGTKVPSRDAHGGRWATRPEPKPDPEAKHVTRQC